MLIKTSEKLRALFYVMYTMKYDSRRVRSYLSLLYLNSHLASSLMYTSACASHHGATSSHSHTVWCRGIHYIRGHQSNYNGNCVMENTN